MKEIGYEVTLPVWDAVIKNSENEQKRKKENWKSSKWIKILI